MSLSLSSFTPETDFENLPPTLQRKYFSSLERLRIAQDGTFPLASPSHRRQLSRSNTKVRRHSQDTTQSKTSLNRRLSTITTRTQKRLPRTTTSSSFNPTADASWFLTLPPKIQRIQFSREEQILLAGQRDSVILDSADEVFYKCSRRASISTSSLQSSLSTASRLWPESVACSEEKPIDSAVVMEDTDFDGFRWLDEEDALDLKLDDYHAAIAETNSKIIDMPRRKASIRRNLSLSSISFRRNSSPVQQGLPQDFLPSPVISNSSRPVSSVFDGRKHRSHTSVSSIDPRAKHYQDPEARLKLRVYLASPQKFDEAVEFGFPSMQDKNRLSHTRPKTSPRLTQESGRTFFSDTPHLSDDDDDDEEEEEEGEEEGERMTDEVEEHDPQTPLEMEFHPRQALKKNSVDKSGVFRSRHIEPYAQAPTTNRETTIYMTLTRPDLRSPEAGKHTKSINDEPLERVDLLCDDAPQSIWDTIPVEGSRVRKFWRRFRLK